MQEAETSLTKGEYLQAIIAARKAFYLAFEWSADIRKFGTPGSLGVFAEMGSTAPSYARNAEYILRQVNDAFCFIVLDHQRIDADLVRDGIDPVAFWNVWRITPKVYLWDDGAWSVSHELSKTERDDLQADAVYVVETVADILLRQEERQRRHRLVPYGRMWTLSMNGGARVFAKADTDALLNHTCEAGEIVDVTSATVGLDGSNGWWEISHFRSPPYFSGYVREEDVDRSIT